MKTFLVRLDLIGATYMYDQMLDIFCLTECKSWTFDLSIKQTIKAFEMYLYRQIQKISWIQKVTNLNVLSKVQKQKNTLYNKEKKMNNWVTL